jgi:hypothetical protein
MDFHPQTTFKTSQSVAWRDVNDEVVILNLKSGEYYTLNDVGQFIWKSAMEGKSIQAIQQAIIETFNVPAEQAIKDLHGFLAGMIKEGMLHEETAELG